MTNVIHDLFHAENAPYYGSYYYGITNPISPNIELIEINVIRYSNGDFLGGPFVLNGRQYGCYCISKNKELKPIQNLVNNSKLTKSCLIYCDYSTRKRLNSIIGESSMMYKLDQYNIFYSRLDIEHGDLRPDVVNALKPIEECSMFFNTIGALQYVESLLSDNELQQWNCNLNEANQKLEYEVRNSCSCIEKPYEIRLFGTDDASWTINATLDEIPEIMKQMSSPQYVMTSMVFTN